MTSQKRFRHQENSNNNSRSRDLPPRFKRQKSSSGQTPLTSRPASPLSSQAESNKLTDKMTKQSPHQDSNSPQRIGASHGSVPQKGLAYSVLPPFANNNADIPNIPPPQQVYGYTTSMSSPQMWSGGAYPGLNAQPVIVNHSPVMLPPPSTQTSHHLSTSALGGVYNNENCAPSPYYMAQCGPMSPWSTSGYESPYQSSCSSPAPTVPSPVPVGVHTEQSRSPQPAELADASANKLDARYTDPDLRTIEMLRELERVADEKESQEADDGGSDRKTLVSHHLRMLMCAVDRYTEGVEEEMAGSTRNDDSASTHGSNLSSPSTSPVPSKPLYQDKQPKHKSYESQRHMWNQDQTPKPVWPRGRPVLGVAADSPPVQHRPQPVTAAYDLPTAPLKQIPHAPWIQGNQPRQQGTDWNLWSSPTFNFYGVIGSPQGVYGPSQSFEAYQDACFPVDKRERKPLYKR